MGDATDLYIERIRDEWRAATLRECADELDEDLDKAMALIEQWRAEADDLAATISKAEGGTTGKGGVEHQAADADHDAQERAAPAADASRDESVPPPGFVKDGVRGCRRADWHSSWTPPEAWAQYDREHGYAPPTVDVAAVMAVVEVMRARATEVSASHSQRWVALELRGFANRIEAAINTNTKENGT